jgi:hypothetical protein
LARGRACALKSQARRTKLKSVATVGEGCPSAARSLSALEADQIIATARGLPPSWCVQILAPHGQISICPLPERAVHTYCWVASRSLGRVARETWRRVS